MNGKGLHRRVIAVIGHRDEDVFGRVTTTLQRTTIRQPLLIDYMDRGADLRMRALASPKEDACI
jgi:hypothetical protein